MNAAPARAVRYSKLAGSIDGEEKMQLAFGYSHFCNVDVEVADGIGLDLLLWALVAIDVWQSFNAISLKTAMQREAAQLRNGRLQSIEAIIQRRQGVTESHDDCFFWRQDY